MIDHLSEAIAHAVSYVRDTRLRFNYPITIIAARYGTYEGAPWLAFPVDQDMIPPECTGGDMECMQWWEDHGSLAIGRGETPDAAHYDLLLRLTDTAFGPAGKATP